MKKENCFNCANRNGCIGCHRDYEDTIKEFYAANEVKKPTVVVKKETVTAYTSGKHTTLVMHF